MYEHKERRNYYYGQVWEAAFEGQCGRPYKYTIKMEGRQVGKVVMFKGTTDLGGKDGGVFDSSLIARPFHERIHPGAKTTKKEDA